MCVRSSFFSYNIKVLSLVKCTFGPPRKECALGFPPSSELKRVNGQEIWMSKPFFFRSSLAALPKILEPKKSV